MKTEKNREESVFVQDVYVASVVVLSSCGDFEVFEYLLVSKKGNTYYEFFSNVKIEDEERASQYDTPYVSSVQPLKDFLVNEEDKYVSKKELIDLICAINAIKVIESAEEITKELNAKD